MISRLDSSALQFLAALNGTQHRLNQAQLALTSGKKVNVISDDPDQISSLLQARAELGTSQQTEKDLGRVKTEVDTAESTLANAVSLVEHARVLAAQGATGTSSPQTRANLADQLGDLLKQLVAFANTTVEGRNIFSGDSDQAAAYSIDLTQPVPTGSFLGTPSTRLIRSPSGTQFAVAKTAQEIFDSANPSENIFTSIDAIRVALLNNDQAGIDAALPNLDSAGVYLNQQHAFYGSAQNQVNDGITYANKDQIRLAAKISGIEDADPATAALELNQAILEQNAALQSRGRLPRTSLFDFLG
ncbi:MAG: flagellin [Bryobacteraceae bacterium]